MSSLKRPPQSFFFSAAMATTRREQEEEEEEEEEEEAVLLLKTRRRPNDDEDEDDEDDDDDDAREGRNETREGIADAAMLAIVEAPVACSRESGVTTRDRRSRGFRAFYRLFITAAGGELSVVLPLMMRLRAG